MTTLDDLNAYASISLLEIGETEDWELRFVAAELQAVPEDAEHSAAEALEELGEAFRALIERGIPWEVTDASAIFEIVFPNYVMYTVLDESFMRSDLGETGRRSGGPIAFVYETSPLLDHANRVAVTDESLHGPLTHYAFWTNDHIVDVLSASAPRITRLAPA